MKHLFVIILLFFFTCLTSFFSYGQIVNVESMRIAMDSTGWAGSMGGDFTLTKNTARIFSANAYGTVQLKTKKNLYLFLGNYGFLKGDTEKFIDNAFLHFRFDHSLTSFLQWEFFVQYQNNKITKIAKRFLLGSGPRFKLPTPEKLKTFLGIDFMYEYEEEISAPVITHRVFRNSSYLAFTYKPTAYLQLVSTTFYQPRLDQFSDFRILNQETATFTITKKLSVTLNWDFLYDAVPVADIPKDNFTFSTGFKYLFNP
ncbi:MAG TPA: DUF481 domain-containing protein [Chitinophagaceae bacterium]|nr:DUF481 domain-containing protein [Chitinophagaceae bacterium]